MTDIANGLTPQHEFFFDKQPDDPEMRESTSIWLFEENGAFGFPRIGIEAEADQWGNPQLKATFAAGGDRVLRAGGRADAPSPYGTDGQPRILGAGPLVFEMIEPFRTWKMTFDGEAVDTTVADQMAATVDPSKTVPVRLEAIMEMQTPCWVEDNSPEKLAEMTPAEREEAASMGIGWRLEHLFRAKGTWTVDGVTREFKGLGSRIKRQSVRPLAQFRGHIWQSALFPDGRAFGYIAYPPFEDRDDEPHNIGYVYEDGKMYPAKGVVMPFLKRLVGNGEDVSLELEYEKGRLRIGGESIFSSYTIHGADMAAAGAVGFNLQQGGARYTLDGMTTYGMIERSALDYQMDKG